jgi:hypothetical protein
LDSIKNVNWSLISLDGLLDFIISQSKLLIKSPELQTVVIAEFSRRFREEYSKNNTENIEENISISDIVTNNSGAANNPQHSKSPRKKSTSRARAGPQTNVGNTNSGNTLTQTNPNLNQIFIKSTSKGQEASFTSELISKLISKSKIIY